MNYAQDLKHGMELDLTAAIMAIKPVDINYDCENCDDTGFALDPVTHRPNGTRCECTKERRAANLRAWKASELERLGGMVSGRVDLAKTQSRPYMTTGTDSLWLHGIAGKGKTHFAAWIIQQAIQSAEIDFTWGWYEIRKLIAAWKNQHSELVDLKIEALTLLNHVLKCEILVIDDIDKIGTITAAREEELYGLIDEIHGKRAQLIVTSQNTIDEFCGRMQREALFMEQGKGPVQRRLKEICKEIKI